jgi:hypothetical protein
MKSLIITDLARTEELGRTAMAAVRGGFKMGTPSGWCEPQCYLAPSDSSIHATQDLKQMQQVVNETADGSAYLNGIYATNNTSQFGQNNIVVG